MEQHPVITWARHGDLIRVIRYVEDRHGLGVRSFQMTLLHKNTTDELTLNDDDPLPTDEPWPSNKPLPTDDVLADNCKTEISQ